MERRRAVFLARHLLCLYMPGSFCSKGSGAARGPFFADALGTQLLAVLPYPLPLDVDYRGRVGQSLSFISSKVSLYYKYDKPLGSI